jgi:hypothetical protein
MAHVPTDSFSSSFLTVLQKASPATQQLMAVKNKFIAMFPPTEANCHESHSNSGSKTAHLRRRKTCPVFFA